MSGQVATAVRDIGRTLRLVWAAGRGVTLLWGALLAVQGLLPVATVQLTRLLVDGLSGAIGGGAAWSNLQPVLTIAAAMAAVLVLTELLQVCLEWIRTAQAELIQDHVARLVQDKSISVDMAFYEKAQFFDHLHRARTDAASRPLALLESTGSAFQNTITLVAMAAVLLPYGLWLPPALLLSTMPAFYVVVRASRRYHTWWNDSTLTRRRIQYFEALLTEPFAAGEVRLFDLGRHFQSGYRALRTQFRTERLTLLKEQLRSRLAAEFVAVAISGSAMVWMLYRAAVGVVTLGDVALFYQAFQRGQGLVRTLLGNVGQIYSNSLYVANLFDFLQLKSNIVDRADAAPAPQNLRSGIRFKDVSFRYPGSESYSLQNFTAFFPAGSVVALVGENGAGKTTLLKLIGRFYDPESGSIEFDGADIRRLSLHSLRQAITFMFQVPGSYQFTARENIALGNLAAAGDDLAIERAARTAAADEIIRRLPQGYDSLLGRFFPGGIELSGGEWQRVALARAFMRPAHLMLLDEPTSAMDSWAETDWWGRLRRHAQSRTVVLATHRLTIAMRADLIHVMRNGQIAESGTHDQLLALNGLYARAWRAQVEAPFPLNEFQTTSA